MTIPLIAKHMAVAIFKKLPGTTKKRSEGAWDITLNCLVKNKLCTYNNGHLVLTPSGSKKNNQHKKEPDSAAKVTFFDNVILPNLSLGLNKPPEK